MKYLIFLLPTLLFSWTFTEADFKRYNQKQLEVLHISYLVGEQQQENVGVLLAAISIVESHAGKFDNNPNQYCGPHQVSSYFSKTPCVLLESNPYISAKLALHNLMFWKRNRTWRQAIIMYNGGYRHNPHGKEYLRRVQMAVDVIKPYLQSQSWRI